MRTVEERFWAKVDITPGCWEWTAGTGKGGYGQFRVGGRPENGGKTVYAHRWSWEHYNGPIADGMEIDHKYFDRACVNPDHLRAVTHKQNNEHLRGAQANNLSSGIRGVTWKKDAMKWRVQAKHNGRHIHGGYFTDLAAAEQAAIALRAQLFTHDDAIAKAA